MGLPPLGSGARFKALSNKLSQKSGIRNPDALAAVIGRRKYGSKKMGKLSGMGRGADAPLSVFTPSAKKILEGTECPIGAKPKGA